MKYCPIIKEECKGEDCVFSMRVTYGHWENGYIKCTYGLNASMSELVNCVEWQGCTVGETDENQTAE